MPIQWAEHDEGNVKRTLQVARKVKESKDVTSFYLRPIPAEDSKLWSFRAGQHLPITVQLDDCDNDNDRSSCEELQRTYSLSCGPDWNEYRISVKREERGVVSQFLHDKVKEGDTITVNKPAGDFVLDTTNDRTLVLLSSGVGITPILSMLHQYVQNLDESSPLAYWIHGAKNGKSHPFQSEINELKKVAGDKLVTHTVYSQPDEDDKDYDSVGRINTSLLQQLVPDLQSSEVYMCGPGAFMATMETGLAQAGVDLNRIHFETF